jgi:hypothetical protein
MLYHHPGDAVGAGHPGRASAPSLRTILAVAGLLAALTGSPAVPSFRVTTFDQSGALMWTDAPVPGVCTVELSTALGQQWTPAQNIFCTNSAGGLTVPLDRDHTFHRLLAVDVSATAQGFTNLVYSYGILEPIAGSGIGRTDNVSYWQAEYEGGSGPAAAPSRPHFAMAGRAGSVYIADKNSHSVLRVSPDGTIHTHAGNHVGGLNGEGPAAATSLQLNSPNGLWVRADGTVYVLDTGNGRVRRVDTNGMMATLFLATANGSVLSGGRGLWVKDDESLAYFGAETKVRRWTPAGGLLNLATGFSELGCFYVESSGDIIVCDRGAHYV